jgi:hypothetical protein
MSTIASPSELRPRLRGTIGVDGYPLLLFRMGYGSEVRPTPQADRRRDLFTGGLE